MSNYCHNCRVKFNFKTRSYRILSKEIGEVNILEIPKFKRLPRHIAIIPDGNRRWALARGFEKHEGYKNGIIPGLKLFNKSIKFEIEKFTFFGLIKNNTKRPKVQKKPLAMLV